MEAAAEFNVGDGFRMDVLVGGPGQTRRVYSRYFDAGRKAEDRRWISLEVPLDLTGSEGERVEVAVSGGPQGDLVADWLALAEVRVDPE